MEKKKKVQRVKYCFSQVTKSQKYDKIGKKIRFYFCLLVENKIVNIFCDNNYAFRFFLGPFSSESWSFVRFWFISFSLVLLQSNPLSLWTFQFNVKNYGLPVVVLFFRQMKAVTKREGKTDSHFMWWKFNEFIRLKARRYVF